MTNPRPVRRALLSVYDKQGIVDFARSLHDLGVELVSTGGTARTLSDAGLPVQQVESLTGFPEMLSGRVKTLHPKVHGGILYKRDDASHESQIEEHAIAPIDLVCVSLYPFEETIAREGVTRAEAIEQIDIGGPAMIRSAAKNHDAVTVVTSTGQYGRLIDELSVSGATSESLRSDYARDAFARTSAYDAMIARYLAGDSGPLPKRLTLRYERVRTLRYGENPHQPAAIYAEPGSPRGLLGATQLHGKELSYNNINDAQAAWDLARSTTTSGRFGACVVKHANPCGASVAVSVEEAVVGALAGDPLAAFGGILAVSGSVDEAAATHLCSKEVFLEVVIASGFTDGALEMLRDRWKNLRILQSDETAERSQPLWLRPIEGGLLAQTADTLSDPATWTHRAGPAPSESVFKSAAFFEAIGRALASNAVCLSTHDARGARLAGAGAGQMDRVAACRIAVEKAGERAAESVAFSDAFFPFPDGPQILIDAGVTTIIHPGGSVRDSETFELCDAHGVTCLTTGVRHFRH